MLLGKNSAGLIYVFEQPQKLLIVDDDPIMREFALAQLSHPGGELITACDGEEAWAILQNRADFDLVLSDLEMPNLTGFGLLDRIRASPRHAHLPVVVITSRDDMFAIDRAYEVGATSFVAKPVNWRLLGYQLRYVLRASRMEQEIRVARDEAERAAKLRDSLLRLLQHETRTPLNAIIGYSQLLQAALSEPGNPRDYIDSVVAAARNLNETLQRIFYFAQLSSDVIDLDKERIQIADAADSAARANRRRAEEASVTILREDEGEAYVTADLRHLTNAVSEIVANAVAASPRGGVVRVESGVSDEHVHVTVEDDGSGLDTETLARCTEAFAQGADPLTRAVGGLGLGLPTAIRILALHEGRLDFEAPPNGGTRARLLLPRSS